MKPLILCVDDELNLLDSYIRELEFDYRVERISDIQKLFEFLIDNYSEIKLLILDVMMPPGNIDEQYDKNTDKGMKTGLILYEIIREKYPKLPIIVFTNVTKNEDDQIVKQIAEDSQARFLQKEDYLPFELSEEIKSFI